jgi:CxC2 like cysteine cluster associated with KDZ transposases
MEFDVDSEYPIAEGTAFVCIASTMGTVVHKIRPAVKRVKFKEKSTTRGTYFKQSTVKATPSPLRSPSKRARTPAIERFEQGGFVEPLLQSKGKVSSIVGHDTTRVADPNSNAQSQNDYLREFSPIIDNIMGILLQMEAPVNNSICPSCNIRQTMWKCSECVGCNNFCNDCIRTRHQSSPYHRVEHWTGTFFEPAWLCQANLVIHLGHEGLPCPNNAEFDGEAGFDPGHLAQSLSDDGAIFGNGLPKLKGRNYHIVVDKSGVHRIRVIPCGCPNAPEGDDRYIHYLQMGLFPASLQSIKTVFTFGVLDDFRMDNLECKTAALNYWHKIVRLTSNEFPKSVPVSALPFRPERC